MQSAKQICIGYGLATLLILGGLQTTVSAAPDPENTLVKKQGRLTVRAKKPDPKKLDRKVVRARRPKADRILPDPWEVIPYIGYTQFKPESTFSDAMTIGVALQYPISDWTLAQFRLDWFRTSKSDEPAINVYNNTGYALEIKHLIGENYKFKLYALSGFAMESFEDSGYFYAGGALHFKIGRKEFPLTLRIGRSSGFTFGIQNYLF